MPTKILILADYPAPNATISGGIPRALYSLTQELKKLAPEIEFHICTYSDEIRKSVTIQSDNLFLHYICFPLEHAPIIVPKQLTGYLIGNIIKKVKPDLIHAHGTGKDYAYPAIRSSFQPTVVTVQGVIHQESKHWEGLKGRYHAITGKRMERYVLSKARHVAAISPYVKEAVRPLTNADVTVIFDPFEPNFLNVEKNEIPNRLLFVGGIEERKGLETLVHALKHVKADIPGVQLHIVGGVRKIRYHQKVEELIKELGLQDQVRFLGRLPDVSLMKEYAEAAVFILPSKEESQGIVLIEAMATGTPVIATNSGGMPYLVEDGRNGFLVSVGDSQAMADRISVLLKDAGSRRTMGAEGKEMAAQFLPEKIAEQHIGLYRQLLKDVNREE
jgi:glycosyltransferase involved in cell wall biosynthesis